MPFLPRSGSSASQAHVLTLSAEAGAVSWLRTRQSVVEEMLLSALPGKPVSTLGAWPHPYAGEVVRPETGVLFSVHLSCFEHGRDAAASHSAVHAQWAKRGHWTRFLGVHVPLGEGRTGKNLGEKGGCLDQVQAAFCKVREAC